MILKGLVGGWFQEVEMGDAPLSRESPTKGFNVNLKSGRKLELP